MGKVFTKNYEIHYYEVDSNLKCKISSIVDFICDIGTQQSEELGGGIEYCKDNNCAWVFYKYDISMIRYPMFREKISITTKAVGFKKFYGLREYIIKDENEEIIGRAKVLFFLINIEKRRPMRIQKEQYEVYGVEEDADNNIDIFNKLEKIESEDYSKEFNIRYTDIDSNKHVNNVKYLDWAIETIPLEVVENYKISKVKVIFEKECKYGESIVTSCVINREGDKIKSHHKIKKDDGTELTLLELEWDKEI